MGLWAGCLLVFLGAGPAGAAPAQERYHAYGLGYTRAGERWTYLGSYDDARAADAACKAARNDWGQPYAELRVVKAAKLALPPARKYTKVLLFPVPGPAKPVATSRGGEFRTLAEATAAAEKVVGAGERFEVLYWEF
jgi:hypothetical protein